MFLKSSYTYRLTVQYFPLLYEDIVIIITITITTDVVLYVAALFQRLVRLHIFKPINSKRITRVISVLNG